MHNKKFETRLYLSKSFPPGKSKIQLGKYTIHAIPSNSEIGAEAVLSFENTFTKKMGGSNPEEEANIVCRFLSLIYNMRVERNGSRISGINIPRKSRESNYNQYQGIVENFDINNYFAKIFYLDDDLARQIFRASHVFSFALNFIPTDPTFAFFLLVVSIECLSSQEKVIKKNLLDLDKKKCERFCRFIRDNYPDNLKNPDENDEILFNELLKTVYYSHRSSFVHGGKEVSSASLMADKLNSSYFKHSVDRKEVKTPGLGWFAKIVRGSILGYLDNLDKPVRINDEELLSRIAFEKAVINIKAKKDIQKGRFVKPDDIDYR